MKKRLSTDRKSFDKLLQPVLKGKGYPEVEQKPVEILVSKKSSNLRKAVKDSRELNSVPNTAVQSLDTDSPKLAAHLKIGEIEENKTTTSNKSQGVAKSNILEKTKDLLKSKPSKELIPVTAGKGKDKATNIPAGKQRRILNIVITSSTSDTNEFSATRQQNGAIADADADAKASKVVKNKEDMTLAELASLSIDDNAMVRSMLLHGIEEGDTREKKNMGGGAVAGTIADATAATTTEKALAATVAMDTMSKVKPSPKLKSTGYTNGEDVGDDAYDEDFDNDDDEFHDGDDDQEAAGTRSSSKGLLLEKATPSPSSSIVQQPETSNGEEGAIGSTAAIANAVTSSESETSAKEEREDSKEGGDDGEEYADDYDDDDAAVVADGSGENANVNGDAAVAIASKSASSSSAVVVPLAAVAVVDNDVLVGSPGRSKDIDDAHKQQAEGNNDNAATTSSAAATAATAAAVAAAGSAGTPSSVAVTPAVAPTSSVRDDVNKTGDDGEEYADDYNDEDFDNIEPDGDDADDGGGGVKTNKKHDPISSNTSTDAASTDYHPNKSTASSSSSHAHKEREVGGEEVGGEGKCESFSPRQQPPHIEDGSSPSPSPASRMKSQPSPVKPSSSSQQSHSLGPPVVSLPSAGDSSGSHRHADDTAGAVAPVAPLSISVATAIATTEREEAKVGGGDENGDDDDDQPVAIVQQQFVSPKTKLKQRRARAEAVKRAREREKDPRYAVGRGRHLVALQHAASELGLHGKMKLAGHLREIQRRKFGGGSVLNSVGGGGSSAAYNHDIEDDDDEDDDGDGSSVGSDDAQTSGRRLRDAAAPPVFGNRSIKDQGQREQRRKKQTTNVSGGNAEHSFSEVRERGSVRRHKSSQPQQHHPVDCMCEQCQLRHIKPALLRQGAAGAGAAAVGSDNDNNKIINNSKQQQQQHQGSRFTYSMLSGDVHLVVDVLESMGLQRDRRRGKYYSPSIMWSSKHLKGHAYRKLQRGQKVNLFPRSWECTRKDALCRNINMMSHLHGARHFPFMPECFVWPSERDLVVKSFERNPRVPWIVKPAGSSQGRGIFITSDISTLPSKATPSGDNWIVERYIDNPLLLGGKKFDLRLYVAVTGFDPLKIYLHKEGIVRLASEAYDNDNKEEVYAHLTNYSINKHNQQHQQHQKKPPHAPHDEMHGHGDAGDVDSQSHGNSTEASHGRIKLSLCDLEVRMASAGVDTEGLWERIEDAIVKTIISVEPRVTNAMGMFVKHADCCFELFGFDILIDDIMRPWLMEVNFAPSMNTDSPLDLQVKSAVLRDLFYLAKVPGAKPDISFKKEEVSNDKNKNNLRVVRERDEDNSDNKSHQSLTSILKEKKFGLGKGRRGVPGVNTDEDLADVYRSPKKASSYTTKTTTTGTTSSSSNDLLLTAAAGGSHMQMMVASSSDQSIRSQQQQQQQQLAKQPAASGCTTTMIKPPAGTNSCSSMYDYNAPVLAPPSNGVSGIGNGSIGGPYSPTSHDDLMEAVLRGQERARKTSNAPGETNSNRRSQKYDSSSTSIGPDERPTAIVAASASSSDVATVAATATTHEGGSKTSSSTENKHGVTKDEHQLESEGKGANTENKNEDDKENRDDGEDDVYDDDYEEVYEDDEEEGGGGADGDDGQNLPPIIASSHENGGEDRTSGHKEGHTASSSAAPLSSTNMQKKESSACEGVAEAVAVAVVAELRTQQKDTNDAGGGADDDNCADNDDYDEEYEEDDYVDDAEEEKDNEHPVDIDHDLISNNAGHNRGHRDTDTDIDIDPAFDVFDDKHNPPPAGAIAISSYEGGGHDDVSDDAYHDDDDAAAYHDDADDDDDGFSEFSNNFFDEEREAAKIESKLQFQDSFLETLRAIEMYNIDEKQLRLLFSFKRELDRAARTGFKLLFPREDAVAYGQFLQPVKEANMLLARYQFSISQLERRRVRGIPIAAKRGPPGGVGGGRGVAAGLYSEKMVYAESIGDINKGKGPLPSSSSHIVGSQSVPLLRPPLAGDPHITVSQVSTTNAAAAPMQVALLQQQQQQSKDEKEKKQKRYKLISSSIEAMPSGEITVSGGFSLPPVVPPPPNKTNNDSVYPPVQRSHARSKKFKQLIEPDREDAVNNNINSSNKPKLKRVHSASRQSLLAQFEVVEVQNIQGRWARAQGKAKL